MFRAYEATDPGTEIQDARDAPHPLHVAFRLLLGNGTSGPTRCAYAGTRSTGQQARQPSPSGRPPLMTDSGHLRIETATQTVGSGRTISAERRKVPPVGRIAYIRNARLRGPVGALVRPDHFGVIAIW